MIPMGSFQPSELHPRLPALRCQKEKKFDFVKDDRTDFIQTTAIGKREVSLNGTHIPDTEGARCVKCWGRLKEKDPWMLGLGGWSLVPVMWHLFKVGSSPPTTTGRPGS